MQHNHKASRYARLRRRGIPAHTALAQSREFDGKDYGSAQVWARQPGPYNPPHDRTFRWVEDTAEACLRFVGYADELACLRHTGWFTNEFQDEILRGAVWQLPGRNCRARDVAGYEDPNNPGAARIDFDLIEGETGDWSGWQKEDARRDAALRADSIAERVAEQEREYQEVWQAGRRYEDLADDIARQKERIRLLLDDRKRARALGDASKYPALCNLIRERVQESLERISEARSERADLLADYGQRDGFADA